MSWFARDMSSKLQISVSTGGAAALANLDEGLSRVTKTEYCTSKKQGVPDAMPIRWMVRKRFSLAATAD